MNMQFCKTYCRKAALNLRDNVFPETESLSREVGSLPMNVEINDAEAEYVLERIRIYY